MASVSCSVITVEVRGDVGLNSFEYKGLTKNGNRKRRAGIERDRGGDMKNQLVVAGMIAVVLAAGTPAISASGPNGTAAPTQMVITVRPATAPENTAPETLVAGDLRVLRGNASAPVARLQRLTGDLADMQLFLFLDDSTRSTSLGTQLPELKTFLESLPATTEVAVGYMRNGGVAMAQAFTADHRKAAMSLRLPQAVPGENGSPYFALSDLVKHWPSKKSTDRRVVMMLTDGVDPYYGVANMDDPYLDAASRDALKEGVMVYSIYLRGAGLYGRNGWVTNFAQSRLIELSEETGGHAYFLGFTDPVTISPFLKDFEDRLENQYQVTIEALFEKGVQPVKLRTELRGLKIESPTHIYVR
jgi:hypothetical protein